MPGVVLIVLAVVALVLLYMLSLAREFMGVTIVAALAIALILGGCALQGWVDLTDPWFWQWTAPIVGGHPLFAAGPAFATIRAREAGITATDETPGGLRAPAWRLGPRPLRAAAREAPGEVLGDLHGLHQPDAGAAAHVGEQALEHQEHLRACPRRRGGW